MNDIVCSGVANSNTPSRKILALSRNLSAGQHSYHLWILDRDTAPLRYVACLLDIVYDERLYDGFWMLYNLTLPMRRVCLLLAIPNHVQGYRRLQALHSQIVPLRWLLVLLYS